MVNNLRFPVLPDAQRPNLASQVLWASLPLHPVQLRHDSLMAWPIELAGPAEDPADDALPVYQEGSGVSDAPGVQGEGVVDPVGLDHPPLRIYEQREGERVLLQVAPDGPWVLGYYPQNLHAPLQVFLIITAQLRHLPTAVGSPGASEEDEEQGAPSPEFGRGDLLPIAGPQGEVRGTLSHQ